MNNAIVAYIIARLKEPSSWTAIGLFVVSMPGVREHLADVLPYVVPLLSGLGVAVPEKKA